MSIIQDTGKFRTHTMDKFYTTHEVSKKCVQMVLNTIPNASKQFTWIEPAAGSGAFLKQFPKEVRKKYAMDIEPDGPDIERQDYLKWSPSHTSTMRYLVIGNPPFGRQSSLAKQFIQNSCRFAEVVAFILPRSFMKPSMYSVFPSLFHKVYELELPFNSFLLNGEPYNVPCVF
jgi:hypothetical protein